MESIMGEDFDAPIKKTSTNPWITFVKKYSRENNSKPKDAMNEIKQLGLYKYE